MKDGEKTTLIRPRKSCHIFLDLFLGFPVLGIGSGAGDWLVRFGGLLLSGDLVVGAARGSVAAVEVDRVGTEGALELGWQGVLAFAEA